MTEKSSIAESFNQFFSSIVRHISVQMMEIGTQINPPNLHTEGTMLFTDAVFRFNPDDLDSVRSQLLKPKPNKGIGLDAIPPIFLRDGAHEICSCIADIINMSIVQGVVPEDWKSARVIPVYKSGKRDNMENYRPISILPAISKVAEKVIFNQLYLYLTDNNLMSKFQSGFRKGFSTERAITYFVDNIRKNMDNGLLAGAVFIDLKKAFDTVDQELLLNKLHLYGVCPEALIWFRSYLCCRQQAVEIEGCRSTSVKIESGVPQASVLGPLMFILFINDLPQCVSSSNVMMYANDTVIYFSAKTVAELEITLGTDINNISNWMQVNKLFLNKQKTEIVIYGTRQNPRLKDDMSLLYEGTELRRVFTYKYLGVFLDQHLSFSGRNDIQGYNSSSVGLL